MPLGLVLAEVGRLEKLLEQNDLRALAGGSFAGTMGIMLSDLPFEDLLLPPNGDV